jgi:glycine/D-amino acid oxidase-like deaminating enzyme
LVNTPGSVWNQVYQQTIQSSNMTANKESRQRDLVFIGNGLIPNHLQMCTFVVPHYAVLQQCRRRHYPPLGIAGTTSTLLTISGNEAPQFQEQQQQQLILKSPQASSSPPTYIYGPHATWVARALHQQGVTTEIVESFPQIQIAAAKKLLWASCLWLLCHYDDDTLYKNNNTTSTPPKTSDPVSPTLRLRPRLRKAPRTVQQVHDNPITQTLLERLVEEFLPSVLQVLVRDVKEEDGCNSTATTATEASPNAVTESNATNSIGTLLSRERVLSYLSNYSYSIPNAIPSKDLALSELEQRNGIWLQSQQQNQQQPLHQALVELVAGREAWQRLIQASAHDNRTSSMETTTTTSDSQLSSCLLIPEVRLAVWGVQENKRISTKIHSKEGGGSGSAKTQQSNDTQPEQSSKKRTVLVIGSGILGSSVALYLSRYPDISVIVVEKHSKTSPPPSVPNRSTAVFSHDPPMSSKTQSPARFLGSTTPASWAWLNANQKRPQSYQWLNQLGLHVWKQESVLKSLPLWNGSLVRFDNDALTDSTSSSTTTAGTLSLYNHPVCVQEGGYAVQGPLTPEQVSVLEPNANFARVDDGGGEAAATTTTAVPMASMDNRTTEENQTQATTSTAGSGVYFFPDEGCVDPAAAVQALQEEAQRLGAAFLFDHQVVKFIDSDGNDNDNNNKANNGLPPKGVECQVGSGDLKSTVVLHADTIVVAAGIGMTDLAGGIPSLLSMDPPGQIVHVVDNHHKSDSTKSDSTKSDKVNCLTRILVDTVQSSHVLQRRDGTIVVGGGALVVGGTACPSAGMAGPADSNSSVMMNDEKETLKAETMIRRSRQEEDQENAEALLQRAAQLAPGVLGALDVDTAISEDLDYHWTTAIRPMPLDGLPIVGYYSRRTNADDGGAGVGGLYLLATHSGMTMGPFLGCMAAGEIAQQISLEILEAYRPARFRNS